MAKQRHPAGLYVLFFTEMWERFSYYGMRALLMLYMVNYFKWTQGNASTVYKWYTSLVYLTPLLGGYLADRYLGNKRAVIIGATLMAIGHFLMAFEAYTIFFSALVFLILGNGFFKPNMSTQVGRLYPPNDPRRDGAYTIFYMGINLGAFLAPLACGWLKDNTVGGYHSGFTLAGIGMVCGLLIYLFGQRWVKELDQRGEPVATEHGTHHAISEVKAESTPTAAPLIYRIAPAVLAVLGVVLAVAAPVLALIKFLAWNTVIALEIASVCLLIAAWILTKVHMAVRDRVLAIYMLGVFVIFFWGGFEQAGNVLNLWADQATDRYLTEDAKPPKIYPGIAKEAGAAEDEDAGSLWKRWQTLFQLKAKGESESKTWGEWWSELLNPVSTEWFQSINALAIFLIAPFFAIMWTALDRRGWNPSIPTKMALGLVLMGLSFVMMQFAAYQETRPTSVTLGKDQRLPPAIKLNDRHQLCYPEDGEGLKPYHAGRLTYDSPADTEDNRPVTRTLHMDGVLPDVVRDHIVRDTAPPSFKKKVEELQEKSNEAEGRKFKVEVQLEEEPPGFDLRYAGFKKSEVDYDPKTKTLSSTIRLTDKNVKELLVAAGDPQFRDTMSELMVRSSEYRVSPWWLFWFYILATLGELCLSPIGLSMVSKLAPARFATMLMGLWLLMSFFGNYLAGALGELYESVAPMEFYTIFVVGLGVASVVLFVLARKIVSMMHGVN